MERLRRLTDTATWWLSRLAFTVIADLVIAGCFWSFAAYKANSGEVFSVSSPDMPQMVCYRTYEEETKKGKINN